MRFSRTLVIESFGFDSDFWFSVLSFIGSSLYTAPVAQTVRAQRNTPRWRFRIALFFRICMFAGVARSARKKRNTEVTFSCVRFVESFGGRSAQCAPEHRGSFRDNPASDSIAAQM